jgi:hypothetical protein
LLCAVRDILKIDFGEVFESHTVTTITLLDVVTCVIYALRFTLNVDMTNYTVYVTISNNACHMNCDAYHGMSNSS